MANNDKGPVIELVKRDSKGLKKTYIYGLPHTKCPKCNSTWEFISLKDGILTVCCPKHEEEKISIKFLDKELEWIPKMSRGTKVGCLIVTLVWIAILMYACPNTCGDSVGSGGSNNSTCMFKNSDGSRTCTSKATKGRLCDYHFNMLDDIYNAYNN